MCEACKIKFRQRVVAENHEGGFEMMVRHRDVSPEVAVSRLASYAEELTDALDWLGFFDHDDLEDMVDEHIRN